MFFQGDKDSVKRQKKNMIRRIDKRYFPDVIYYISNDYVITFITLSNKVSICTF